MFAFVEISAWHWAAFIIAVLFFLALDLGIFHREAHVVHFKEALGWTFAWFTLAMLFAGGVYYLRGLEEAEQFVTGYIIEYSLSMDNVFVIAMIFAYFRVPPAYQHRVLFWGILGALIMRGVMIGAGVALVSHFKWILYWLGAFLVVSGIKMIFTGEEGVHPEKNPVVKLANKFYPVSNDYVGQNFTVKLDGRRVLTPLALVLLMVETTDLIFALDSIPAIFGVTDKAFIIFTSNVFAILGLRSLYFLLGRAITYLRYLKAGLSIVLVFIGLKMLLPYAQKRFGLWPDLEISTSHSLLAVGGIIIAAIAFSVIMGWIAVRRGKQAD
jgi:tellurite resistance protein TerC